MSNLVGEDLALSDLFLKAQEMFNAIENGPESTANDDVQTKINLTLDILHRCQQLVRVNCIFSKDEIADDLDSQHLLYALVEFYLGILTQKLVSKENDRPIFLRQAEAFLHGFLATCEKLAILTEKERKHFQESDQSVDAQTRRTRKIERFQQEREDKKRLENVIRLKKICKDEDRVDEDLEREHALILLHSSIRRSFDDLSAIEQECAMLEQMAALRQNVTRDGLTSQTDTRQKPSEKELRESPGIVVTHINQNMEMKRETIKAQVFQPGYNLPTMTLQEFADEEMRQAKKRQEMEANAPKAIRKYKQLEEDGEEDDADLVDQATSKDREWDDWKDANPRGIGNKKGGPNY